MALLGTYGGADDVRIYQNRILAEQAGALIPEGGGGITYPKPTLTELPTITIADDTMAGEFVVTVSSPGILTYDKTIESINVAFYSSQVGTTNINNTLVYTVPVNGELVFNTKDFPDLVRPCVIYAQVAHMYPNGLGGVTGFNAYTDGKQIPALPVSDPTADPTADPVVRTASTKTTRKAVTV